MSMPPTYDAIVVGGGPAGATAADDLARAGHRVLLLERGGRIKPCGGAVPPRLLDDFQVPDSLVVARARSARIVAPSGKSVDMPIDGGFVGLVDRETFDAWLRARAVRSGAELRTGTFDRIERDADGTALVVFREGAGEARAEVALRARCVIGADGANSAVARQAVPKGGRPRHVFAYHEVIRAPEGRAEAYDGSRCDIYYRKDLSPDFYAWVFPHGETASVGVGSAQKGFALRKAVRDLRAESLLEGCTLVRSEGAPIPLKPLRRWDNGRDVVLAGDAAGVVAPASGEGIYYAMLGGRLAADAAHLLLKTGKVRALATARRRFMRAHGLVFLILGIMQRVWYRNDTRRERFVAMCADPDVQRLTWEAYMSKELALLRPIAHVRIFLADLAHLMGLARI
ncbi:geranylgeranyl diphosphate reductase [Zavarzinia sp. CC-PAN008]|uniref:geranylgeranyl diphosphate reductase n=1 Tax=Zavarzinia sp. CC-PAN008 TaxID=3243332 RepID=UPI003F743E16